MVEHLVVPVTLILLLSMAKLQKGQEHTQSDFIKRWQTPHDVLDQTQDAIRYYEAKNHTVIKIVGLYTNSLYFNDDCLAIDAHHKYSDLTSDHKRKTQKLFEQAGLIYSYMVWDELLQAQDNVQQTRVRLQNCYAKHPELRRAVQADSLKRSVDESIQDELILYPSDMFVLEEAGLLSGLATGYLAHDKFDPQTCLALVYPGPPLKSIQILLDKTRRTRAFKGRPSHPVPLQFSALDVSIKSEPVETVLCRNTQ